MKTNSLRRYVLLSITSLFTAAILTACGGGGSSSGGGGVTAGKASIAGNVNSGVAANQPSRQSERLLATLLALAVSDAHATGVGGVTVELLKDGVVVASQTTNGSGDFEFTGLAPGSYTINLTQGGQTIGNTPVIQLDPNTRTKLNLNLNGGINSVEIEAEENTISGGIEDELSNDDQQSEDDVSNDEDQKSEDDVSKDDDQKPEDDESKDDDQKSEDGESKDEDDG